MWTGVWRGYTWFNRDTRNTQKNTHHFVGWVDFDRRAMCICSAVCYFMLDTFYRILHNTTHTHTHVQSVQHKPNWRHIIHHPAMRRLRGFRWAQALSFALYMYIVWNHKWHVINGWSQSQHGFNQVCWSIWVALAWSGFVYVWYLMDLMYRNFESVIKWG